MRLIIEVDNDQELKQAQSLIGFLHFSSVDIKVSKKEKIDNLLKWCEQNQYTLTDNIIPSREERNVR